MFELLFASVLFSLSFGLIKSEVAGIDPVLVSLFRLSLSFAAFLPFARRVAWPLGVRLAAIGFVQFGAMYCLYISAFQYLAGHEVAVLTVTTPLFVALIDNARVHRTRICVGALIAVAAALVLTVRPDRAIAPTLSGVVLLQSANFCFAAGQIAYRHIKRTEAIARDHTVFAWLYLGGMLAPVLALPFFDRSGLPERPSQWLALAYLGLVPSGLGFYLWNRGATLVNAGTAAVMNNLKVPLAVALAWLLFGESVEPLRLGASAVLFGIALYTVRSV